MITKSMSILDAFSKVCVTSYQFINHIEITKRLSLNCELYYISVKIHVVFIIVDTVNSRFSVALCNKCKLTIATNDSIENILQTFHILFNCFY